MPTAFKTDDLGTYIEADPDSDLDYSVTAWLEGMIFVDAAWFIEPAIPNVPYGSQVNGNPVVIDGVTYQAGELASVWLKDMQAGQEYTVTIHATFTGGRIDDRSFRVKCRER